MKPEFELISEIIESAKRTMDASYYRDLLEEVFREVDMKLTSFDDQSASV